MSIITTDRLVLRPWKEEDLEPFAQLNADPHVKEIVSFTAVQNTRSRAVMERIGMTHNPNDDFDNPRVPEGHSLRRHVLYRLKKEQWILLQKGRKRN